MAISLKGENMLILEIIGIFLLYWVWKYETQDTKDLGMPDLFIRVMIAGLAILGAFIIFIDLLNLIVDKVG